MDALGAFLSERGFLPEIDGHTEGQTDGDQLKVCNCPYRSAVSATRLPCRLELQMFEQVSGRSVERTEYILDGDPCCVYQFGKELAPET